ncbi:MAG: A24 family peptidase [Jatrophihabitantaceae bacterium]
MSTVAGAVLSAVVCVAAAPALAGLRLAGPEPDADLQWQRPGASRTALAAAVALVLGTLGGAAAGWSALLPAFIALALAGTPLVLIDVEHHRLPNRLVFTADGAAAVLLTVAAAVRHDWSAWLRGAEGAVAVFAVLYLIVFIAPRSFGFGDVKLAGLLGAYLGWFGWLYVYYGIFAGFLLGSVVAIALLATGRASLRTKMAFGPTLILGPLIVLAFDLVPSLS